MGSIKRVANNCIILDSSVISYETKVAEIDHLNKTVTELGKWSRTTSKHVNLVVSQLGYTLVKYS